MLTNHNILLCQEGSARYLSARLGKEPEYWQQYLDKDRRRMTWNREFFRSFFGRPGRLSTDHCYFALGNLLQFVEITSSGLSASEKVSGYGWSRYMTDLNPHTFVGTEFSLGGALRVLQSSTHRSQALKPELATTLAADLMVKADLCKRYSFDYALWDLVENNFAGKESALLMLLAEKQQSMRQKGEL